MAAALSTFWSSPTTKDAFRLSIASLVITVAAIVVGGVFYAETGLSVCLVFALENIVDFLSSVVVLWRFYAPATVDEKLERLLDQRETRASVAISFIMICLGLFVLLTAIIDLAKHEGGEDLAKSGIVVVSIVFSLAFTALTILKFRYGAALSSDSLRKDGVCSFIGASLGVTFFLDVIIVSKAKNMWWFDPVVSFIAGLIALWLGVRAVQRAINVEKHAVFKKSWWFSEKDETPGGDDVELPPLEEAHPDAQSEGGGVV